MICAASTAPHPGAFEESLELIARSAHRLITLTPGAAAQIRERWDREATVIPHPHVVPLEQLERRRPSRRRPVVGMDLHRMPPHLDPMPMLETLVQAVADRAAASQAMGLRLSVHAEVLTPGTPVHDAAAAARLEQLSRQGLITLDVDHRPAGSEPADELWERLRALDLCVLPFRFGSHSRWVEACHDVGTRVLTPTVGFFAQQRPGVLSFTRDSQGNPSATDVVAALDHVFDEVSAGFSWYATRLHRTAQRQRIAHQHEQLYREVFLL